MTAAIFTHQAKLEVIGAIIWLELVYNLVIH